MDEKIWDCNRVESISLDFVEPITARSGSRLSWYKSQVSENAVPDIELLTVNIKLGRNQWKAQVRNKTLRHPNCSYIWSFSGSIFQKPTWTCIGFYHFSSKNLLEPINKSAAYLWHYKCDHSVIHCKSLRQNITITSGSAKNDPIYTK